ncbi:hypothetical protein GCM10023168_29150 [Fodinibacter luteus]|uniref:MOSC domain-containing protein n=1 Tax=Fodinibacter luteus TaxID=552064 RepID=A0ABP8KME4_9MICO
MDVIRVRAIRTFPEAGEPGVAHEAVRVGVDGLEGDRRKKAAVSLVGDDAPATRANLVLDVPTGVVEALEGSVLRVGDVLLAVEATGTSCPGLYAAVGESGWVRVGDAVEPR